MKTVLDGCKCWTAFTNQFKPDVTNQIPNRCPQHSKFQSISKGHIKLHHTPMVGVNPYMLDNVTQCTIKIVFRLKSLHKKYYNVLGRQFTRWFLIPVWPTESTEFYQTKTWRKVTFTSIKFINRAFYLPKWYLSDRLSYKNVMNMHQLRWESLVCWLKQKYIPYICLVKLLSNLHKNWITDIQT